MKRFLKGSLSVFLGIVIFLSVLPVGASALEEPEVQSGTTDTSFSGNTGLNLIAANLVEGEENEDYAISYIEMEGNKAYVDVGNADVCNLIVAIYDETTMQMLASGMAEVPTEHSEIEVDIDIESMPEYFIVKAYLTDEQLAPLCKSYESFEYTSEYEIYLEKTPEDFSDDNIIVFDDTKETVDFAVLDDGTVVAENNAEMTFSYDEATGTYTFFNATDEVKNLLIGDVYYYEYGTKSNEFLLIKVKLINVSGANIEIVEDKDISLEEAFSFVRIDAQGDYDDIEIDESQLGSALTVVETFDTMSGSDPEFDVDTGEKSWSTTLGVNWQLWNNDSDPEDDTDDSTLEASISGTLGYELSTSVKLIYDVKLFGKDYYEFKSEIKHKITLVGFEVEGKLQLPQDVCRIPIPDIPVGPFTLEINIAPVIELSASFGFDIAYTIKTIITADNSNGIQKTKNTESDWDASVEHGIEVKFGLTIEIKLKFSEIVSLALSGEGGIKYNGQASTVGVWLDQHHDCSVCIEGAVNGFVEIKLNLKIKIIPKVIDFNWDAVKWSDEWYLFDFYMSLSSNGFTCGKGQCVKIEHKITITVVDVNNQPINGAEVSTSSGLCDSDGDGKYGETQTCTNSSGNAVFYFRKGEHSISVAYDGKTYTESVKVLENEKIITVVFLPGVLNGNENVGDLIEFGSYPQTEVTDTSLLSALNSLSLSWASYGYYSGTGNATDSQMQPRDYMKYADVTYNGNRYRAVKFTEYRPYYTGYQSSTNYTYQDDNGYYTNTVYWFKFEPLKWRVLDPSEGLVICESIIDSQPYNNTVYYNGSEYFQDISCTAYANDYAKSTIRDWLNDDFYHTAFTTSEKANIKTTTCNNSSHYTSKYNSATTNDNIFLLSYWDTVNTNYGLSSSDSEYDTARRAQGTDYAKAQGLYVVDFGIYNGKANWWLRTPGGTSYFACRVSFNGRVASSGYEVYENFGVRPALKLNIASSIYETYAEQSETISIETEGETDLTEYRVSKSRCVDNEEYVLIVLKSGAEISELSDDDLLYIDQKTAESGMISFNYVPKIDVEADVYIIGMSPSGETAQEKVGQGPHFEVTGGAKVVEQGGVDYIVGLQPSLTKAKLQSAYISCENLSVEYNMTTACYIGTGSTVTVKSNDGEVTAEFAIIIYGDVNGDSWHDGQDAVVVSAVANGLLTEAEIGSCAYMAADCNADGKVDDQDVALLQSAGLMIDEIDQTNTYGDSGSITVAFNGNGATDGTMVSQGFEFGVEQNLELNEYSRSYKIAYELNDGVATITNANTDSVYSFKSWNSTPNGNGLYTYSNGEAVTNPKGYSSGNAELYAQWIGGGVQIPTPTKEYNEFVGWYTDPEFKNEFILTDELYYPTENITLYAKWQPHEFEVMFNDVFDFDMFDFSSALNGTVSVDRENKSVTLYSETWDTHTTNYADSTRGYMTLIPGHTYRFSYDWENLSDVDDTLHPYAFAYDSLEITELQMYNYYKLPAPARSSGVHVFTETIPEGHPFVTIRFGVAGSEQGGSIIKCSNIHIQDITNLDGVADDVSVPMNTDGETIFNVSVEYGNKVSSTDKLNGSLPIITRTGYTFAGWYDSYDENGNGTGNLYDENSVMGATDLKLYAKWIKEQ